MELLFVFCKYFLMSGNLKGLCSMHFRLRVNIICLVEQCTDHFLLVLHATPDSLWLDIGAHGTDVSVGIQLLSGETLLQAKNSAGRRWDSNPGPFR